MIKTHPFAGTLFGVLLLVSAPLAALEPSKSVAQYGLDAWTSREGLPQNSVKALLQTRDGYLWLGTEEGLVRFDGSSLTAYSTRNTDAFRQNTIEALAEGNDGSLWIGTADGLLRKRGERFTAYRRRDGLADDSILSLLSDPDGTLWIGTEKGGLARWKSERFLPTRTRADGLPAGGVMTLSHVRDGSLWIGTEDGLACLRGSTLLVYRRAQGLPSDHVNSILQTRDGAIWLATSGGAARVREDRVAVLASTGQPPAAVNALVEDRDGNIWLGTARGLGRIRGDGIEWAGGSSGSVAPVVLTLLEDREKSLWIGTDGAGLMRLRDAAIVSYTRKDGLSNDYVRPVLADAKGTVWFGTRGGGLNRLENGRFSALTTRDGLPHDSISALGQSQDGSLWVGTSLGGLARWQAGRLQTYPAEEKLSSRAIRVLFEDRRDALWIGTGGAALHRLEGGRFTAFSTADGLAGDSIQAICEDAQGSLWVGTTSGLSRGKEGTFVTFREADGLSIDSIRSLHADPDGTLWIGTSGGGLVRRRDGRFAAVTAKQGLYDDVVFSILDDGRGNLWMSCNRGIFRVARRELESFFAGKSTAVTCVAYAEADGMATAECNGGFQPAGFRGPDGRLWFATIRGVSVVDPAAIRVNGQPPPVVLERLLADGRDVGMAAGLALPPGTRSLEVRYAGLSFLGPERIRFQYRLDPFDKDWIDAGTRRAAYYTNLSPRHYVFRVAARNSDGVWNRAGASLAFSIRPRWVQTRAFAVGLAAAILAVVFGAYRFRVSSLNARAGRLEAGIQEALSNIRVLRGLFPICASCKKIRDDTGYWSQIEAYIRDHSEAEFSHSICPDCVRKLYPDYAEDVVGGAQSTIQ